MDVEDDHALRDVLLRGLRDEEYDTVAAPDGATALRPAGDGVSAAVLDIGLPDADGRRTSRWRPGARVTAYASTSRTTAPGSRSRSPGGSSSRGSGPTRTTGTAERVWGCRRRDGWPAPFGGEVHHDPGHGPGARFVVSLPAG